MTKTFRETHITGEGFRTLAIYRLFFRAELRRILKREADYEAEVREWYETGDGAAPDWQLAGDQPWFDGEWDRAERQVNVGGKGYRFPYCIHGTDLTTDYDNICGGCEEGATAITLAIGSARERFLRFNKRWEWVSKAPSDLPHEARLELNRWVTETFPSRDELA